MRLLIKVAAIYVISSCFVVSAIGADTESSQVVQDLLAKSSGANIQQEIKLYKSLLQRGPDAIGALCQLVQPSGDDTRPRTVLMGLATYVGREGSEKQRRLYSQAICTSLKTIENKEIKAFLIELLQWTGKDECVNVLSPYLTDERLCDPAIRTLTRIGTAPATKALIDAIDKLDTAKKAAVILSLGMLRAEQAVGQIEPFANSKDKALRQSAQWALSNIGYEPLAGTLEAEYKTAKGYEKSVIAENYLLLASRLAEKDAGDKSVKMCRKLLAKTAQTSAHIQAGALETLVTAVGPEAMSDLMAAAASDDDQVQAAAVSLANRIPGRGVTAQWTKMLRQADPGLAVRILTMLGQRGDTSAMPGILQAMKHSDAQVVVAAVNAAATLSPDEASEPILAMLQAAEQSETISAGVDALMRMSGEKALSAVANSLDKMTPAAQVKLMDGLADRYAKHYSASVMAQTADDDKSVRHAAMKAMKNLAGEENLPALVELMLSAQADAEKKTVQRAVIAAAEQIPDSQKRADHLLKVLSTAEDSDKAILLHTLGPIGGQKAIKVVLKFVQDPNPDIKDAAIRAMAEWPDEGALDGLMGVIKTEELKYQVIALRGGLKILQNSSVPDKRKMNFAKEAMKAVKRPEEKRLIVGWLGQIKSMESLEMAGMYLDDEQLQAEAALVAAKIALPDNNKNNGLGGYETATILKNVAGLLNNEKLNQQVIQYIETLPKSASVKKPVPEGFTDVFNGKNLSGWKGVLLPPYDNPVKRATLDANKRAELQDKADKHMRKHWHVEAGVLVFDGKGFSVALEDDYEDFEMLVDWKLMHENGDSGIYLRGSPQVQIWDPAQHKTGSGGLYNNQKNPSKPTMTADNPIGQWNTFRIRMIGEKVTVHLNGKLVVDNVTLENYWDRSKPIFPREQIELQCHGNPVSFRNIFIREIPRPDEFVHLFNGRDLTGWTGDTSGYIVEDGNIVCKPGGNLYTEKQYSDFVLKFEFKLTAGANNGLGIRTPIGVDAAYQGMELQILDNTAAQYANLQPYQYHGSIYGVVPARRGHLKPVGQWNSQEVIARGNLIKVVLNGTTIVDADIAEASKDGTMDGHAHPGLKRKGGHIGFLGHGSVVEFRNIRINQFEEE